VSTASTLNQIRTELNEQFYERESAIDVMLLAVLSREHGFIIGPPGTGKSKLVREFAGRFVGATYFEQLLSKNRPDQAVLGPWDLPLLRDKGEFRRRDEGFLTTADIVFLDELGKASPTLGHDLLAATNERVKHEVANGRSAQPIPLHTLLAASNEHPAGESEDAAAMWDRLLLRVQVDYISSDSNFIALMDQDPSAIGHTKVLFSEVQDATKEVQEVAVSAATLDGLLTVRNALRDAGMQVSDRRLRKSLSVVKANAWLAGRNQTQADDLGVLQHTLWEDLEQIKKVQRLILGVAAPVEQEALELLDDANEILANLKARKGEASDKLLGAATEANGKATLLWQKADKLPPDSVTAKQVKVVVRDIRAVALGYLGIPVDSVKEF